MEMNVEKTELMRISRQQSSVQIMKNKKQRVEGGVFGIFKVFV